MKKFFSYCVLSLVGLFGFAYASVIPSGFIVEIQPNSFPINQAVDVTIKAIDANGQIIRDYDGFVFIDLIPVSPGLSLSYDDYVLPGEGFVFFEPGDLGQKTLSKSLIVKKNGTYTLKVFDMDDERVIGQRDIIVGQVTSSSLASIAISSPVLGGIETTSTINIIASAATLPNSPYQILLNGSLVATGISNGQGNIVSLVTGAQQGVNSLQIKIVDVNAIVLGESPPMTFVYEPNTDDFFYGIQILPSVQTKQGDKLVFSVSTSDDVSSVELLFGTGIAVPMDRESAGKYFKQLLMEHAGTVPVGLYLYVGTDKKLYQDVATVTVEPNTAIGIVKFYTQAIDKSSLVMLWQVLGQSSGFVVKYGTNQNNLTQEIYVGTNEIEISNINPSLVYYFQIVPVDHNRMPIGTPSDIREIDPNSLQSQLTCFVDGISLRTENIDGSYYFLWDPIENAQKYYIYRSDTMTSILSEMRKVGETTETRFSYPFDAQALQEEYAYYAVVAVCNDGKEIIVDQIKKVEVGPYDTLLLAVLSALLFYSLVVLYRRSI